MYVGNSSIFFEVLCIKGVACEKDWIHTRKSSAKKNLIHLVVFYIESEVKKQIREVMLVRKAESGNIFIRC
jgi:hypothetical protein